LDSFVGFGAFQWVMGNPKRKMKAAAWTAAPAWLPFGQSYAAVAASPFALPGPIGKTFR
jgi:hypothetical protein